MKGNEVLNEESRLNRLHPNQVLDSAADKAFDDLVYLAAQVCNTPLAAISLVNQNRQWFKTGLVFSNAEIPGNISVCSLALQQKELLEIEDVWQDERFSHFPFNLKRPLGEYPLGEHPLREHPLRQSPGVRFYAVMPLISSGGEAVGTLCVMDTEVRRMDENQRLSLKALAGQVVCLLELRSQNRALEAAREESQKALRAKAEFLSVMSHELRTPLNGMLGMVHWLLQDTLRPEQQELVTNLKFSAENLLSLINHILDHNKLNAQKLELEKIDFDLAETLQQLSCTFSFAAQQKGLSFQTSICDKLPMVVGDPLRLTQVLTNLLGNAVKFTSKGEVKLAVSPVMETENYVTLKFQVKDTGIGIAPEHQERIFEEFSQASTDISRKFGGSGLGLSISRNLLRLMESDIQVKSELNKGSEFIFSLSFRKSARKKDQERDIPDFPEVKFSTKRILLTEDNAVNQLVTLNFLNRWGFETDVAENGVEAVHMVKKNQYDLILMDLQMPELDGFGATRQIRSLNSYYRNVPIIALTASAVLEVEQEAFESGVSDFLMKPYKPKSLYNLLHEIFCKEEEPLSGSSFPKKIAEIAGEDTIFKDELTRLYLKSFQEILEELKAGKLENIEDLRRIRHKHNSTFQLLQLNELSIAMANLQNLLEKPGRGKKAIAGLIKEISTICQKLIKELEKPA